MMRNMITIGLLLVSFQTWGQDQPPAKGIVSYEELMEALQQADEATRTETLGEIQKVMDAFQKENWVIEFFLSEEGDPEPFLPLLDRALPIGSQVTWDPRLMTLAVYTTPKGLRQVEELVMVVDSLAEHKREREQAEAEERQRRPSGESFPGVFVEFLILEGEEITDASAPSISQEARGMDLTESDLSFMGPRAWRTYGQGFVHASERFDTRVGSTLVTGIVEWRGESRVRLGISITWELENESTRELFTTETVVELGRTVLLGTTETEGPMLLAARARLDPGSTAPRATELEP